MLPNLLLIKQKVTNVYQISNAQAVIKKTLDRSCVDKIQIRGKTIGIAVGSRGIDNLEEIVKGIVQYVKTADGNPIVFAAMGSHGGGTAKGQLEVLAALGITEANVGAPVESCSLCDFLGTTESGIPVYYNSIVHKFDSMVVVNRVKPHTDFSDETESGLLKMLSIGIGNQKGCMIC